MTTITIGDLVLAERLDQTTDYEGFYFSSFKDWYSTPQSKAPNESRPDAHGSFDGGRDYREAATPSVEGGFVGRDEAAALAAIDVLNELSDGDSVVMALQDALRTTSREVSIRFLDIPDHHGRRSIKFSVDMLAEDPRRYESPISGTTGVPVVTGGRTWPAVWPVTWAGGGSDGRVTVLNPGNAETYSLLEVTGGLGGGFSLVEVGTGREIRYEQFIAVGSTVFMNPRTGAVYIDSPDNDKSGALTRADWTPVPRMGQSIWQFVPLGAVTGTPTFTVRTAPAYW